MPVTKTKTTTFDPFATSGAYDAQLERWQLETDFAEMTLEVLKAGTWLRQFPKEHADDFAYRKSMSVPLDICRDAVRIRIDNLWRKHVEREVDEGPHKQIIERLIHDADGDQTTLDAFMRRAVYNHYVTGCDIVTQMTAVPEEVEGPLTKAQEGEYNIRPYFMQFPVADRYDWAVNGTRNFIWARYCLGTKPATDEREGADSEATHFLTLTDSEWRLHEARHEPDEKGNDVLVVYTTSDTHGFGRPPIIKFYFAESQKAGQGAIPLSLLTRPAVVAKVALNLKSQADADLLAAVTRWFATGVGNDELPDSYGPNTLIKFASEKASISVLQGDVGHLTEKRHWLLLYLGEILRLLKFRGGMAEIEASAGSGLRLALERTDLENELRATADFCEATELEMMRQAVCLATGADIPPERAAEELKYSARYNRDFVLEPLGEMIENVIKWVRDGGILADSYPEIGKEMARQIVNQLAREGTPQHKAMAEEIDSVVLEGPAPKAEEPAE